MPVTEHDFTVVSEELPGSQVGLTIEVPQATVDAAYERVLNRLARRSKIEGFRPGKAPRALIEARVGAEALREEVIDSLVPEVLAHVIEERKLEPVASPRVDVLELDRGKPGKLSATVSVRPDVILPDLNTLAAERHVTEVTEEMVRLRLEALREAFAEIQPVERAAADGDVVVGDIEVHVEGQPVESQNRKAAELELKEGVLIPELRAVLPGKETGDTAEAEIRLPDDLAEADLAGKPALLRVTVQGVKEKHLPALDDELAGKLSEGKYTTVAELEAGVRNDLEEQAKRMDALAFEQAILKEVVDKSNVDVPQALVEAEVERELEDLERRLGRQGVKLDRYLAYQDLTPEQWQEQAKPDAESRLKVDLVMNEIARTHGIEPTDQEVDEAIEREAARDEELANQVPLLKESATTRRYFRRRLQRLRSLDLLVDRASQGAKETAVSK